MEKQTELQNEVFKQKYWFSIAPEVQASAASTAVSSPRMSLEEVCQRRCRKKIFPRRHRGSRRAMGAGK